MANLWTFGDSFTDYFKPPENNEIDWRQKYTRWKGYVPKVYGEIIAEKLNLNLINKGRGGVDNNQIFEDFCSVLELIKEEDLVIFGWTNQERFRLSTKNDEWGHFCANFRDKDKTKEEGDSHFFSMKSLDKFESIAKNTILQIMVNRMSSLYTLELCNWIKLINFSIKNNKILHWSWDSRMENCNVLFINSVETIRKETNGLINDAHWAESEHYKVADMFIELLNENRTKTHRKLL